MFNNEYDMRQYNIMLNIIEEYKENKKSLKQLIDNLDGLLNALENAEQKWKDEFHNEWWNLEQVYAVNNYRGKGFYSEEESKIINESIDNLQEIILMVCNPKSSP